MKSSRHCRAWLLAPALAGAAAGCHFDFWCWAGSVAIPAIVVEVRDSVTGSPAAWGASGTAQGQGIVDVMRVWDVEDSLDAHQLRTQDAGPGAYTVTVTKPGYAAWRRTGVVVGGDRCGATTVNVLALLQPLPSSRRS